MTNPPQATSTCNTLETPAPQTHYKRPWPQIEAAWRLTTFLVLPIALGISILVPGGRIAILVTYTTFIIVGAVGLVVFTLTDPAFGLPHKVQLPRIPSDDEEGTSAIVSVYAVKPFFGRKQCEQLGGRYPNKLCVDNSIDYDEAYVRYKRLFGTKVDRYRWEPAVFVVGSAETQDYTAVAPTPTS